MGELQIAVFGGFIQPPGIYQPLIKLLSRWGSVGFVDYQSIFRQKGIELNPDILVGHSLGAIKAIELLCLGEVRPKALILFSAALRSPWREQEISALRQAMLSQNNLELKAFFQGCCYPARLSEDSLAACMSEVAAGDQSLVFESLDYLRQVDLRGLLHERLKRPDLPRILSFFGADDQIIPATESEHVSEELGTGCLTSVCSLRRAGHWLIQQKIADVAEEINRFL